MRSSIYQRSVQRGRNRGKKEKRYTIAYELANGRMKHERAYSDLQASRQLLARRQREVAHGIEGLSDKFAAHKRRPIAEHFADYKTAQLGNGAGPDHAKRTGRMLAKMFATMNVSTLLDIDVDKTLALVAELVTVSGSTLTTRNHYASALHSFGAWLEETERLPKNPFAKVRTVKVTDADRERRYVPTLGELQRICAVAPPKRRLVYWSTAFTGFRRGEDKAISWADVHIDDGKRFVSIRGEDEKTGDDVDVPIPVWLAEMLRKHRAEATLRAGGKLDASAPVFHVPAAIVQHLKRDAAKAGVGTMTQRRHKTANGNSWRSVDWIHPSGKVLVLHSLRALFCTMLFEANLTLHDVQRLCRHDSIRTTEKHYLAWREGRAVEAVDRLPDPLAVPVAVAGIPNPTAPVRAWPDVRPDQEAQAHAQ